MLRVCQLQQHGSFVCRTNTKLETLCIFNQTGLALPIVKSKAQIVLPQDTTMSSFDNKPIGSDVAIATLRFYPISCLAAIVGMTVFGVFRKDSTVIYRDAQCGHRTGNLTITNQRSNKLSCTAAFFFHYEKYH